MSAPPAKPQRATTSTKNRPRSPSPYRTTSGTTAPELCVPFASSLPDARRCSRTAAIAADSPLSSCSPMQRQRVSSASLSPASSLAALTLACSAPCRFWQHTINTAEQSEEDFKHQALPLARIKKVMKSDPEVRVSRSYLGEHDGRTWKLSQCVGQMISSEVTVLFEKACQSELSSSSSSSPPPTPLPHLPRLTPLLLRSSRAAHPTLSLTLKQPLSPSRSRPRPRPQPPSLHPGAHSPLPPRLARLASAYPLPTRRGPGGGRQ